MSGERKRVFPSERGHRKLAEIGRKMGWELILIIVLGFLLILVFWNFYFRYKTLESLDRVLKRKKWGSFSKRKYLRKCYDLVGNKFGAVKGCWLKYPWRNIYYRNIWNFKGAGMPCHIQNSLFQHCLLKKFNKKEMKTIPTINIKKIIIPHFYSRVKINKTWIDVDVYEKARGLPFGKNIHYAGFKG